MNCGKIKCKSNPYGNDTSQKTVKNSYQRSQIVKRQIG